MNTKRTSLSILTALLMVFANGPRVLADDTDIYTLPPQFSSDAAPKVLLVFDTSGSMGWDVTSRPAYDPTFDYITPYVAATGSSIAANRIYWDNRSLSPPDASSNKWIDVADLQCQAAIDYFATADNVGYFGDDSVNSLMVQHRESSNRRWRYPSGWSKQMIDCIQDSDSSDAQTDRSSDIYLNRGNDNDGYTSNYNQRYTWSSTNGDYRVRLYTANYIAYSSDTSTATTRARLRVAKDAVKAVISDNPTVKFGLMTFNTNGDTATSGGRIVRAVAEPDTEVTYQSTTLAANASSGDTVIEVDDPRQFDVGEKIVIDLSSTGTHETTVAGEVTAKLTAQMNIGSTSMTVDDASGFAVGDDIGIENNDGIIEWHTISGIAGNTITVSVALAGSEDANQTQPVYGRKITLAAAMTANANTGSTVSAKAEYREYLRDTVELLIADGRTPIAESTYEAYRYFAGKTVVYGNPASHTPVVDLCAQDASCASASGTYISPLKYECEKAYIVMMTDGAPSNDTNEQQYLTTTNFPAIPASEGEVINGNPTYAQAGTGNGAGLIPLARWMYMNDINPGLGNTQTARFYAIGFGGDINTSLQAYLDLATQAGTGNPSKSAYTVSDVSDLQNAFQQILGDIKIETASFGAPTLSVNAFNKLYNRDEVYFALFEPSTSYKWNGNLKKYRLCDSADATAYGCEYGDVIDQNNANVVDPTTKRIKTSALSYWGSSIDGSTVTAGGAGESTSAMDPDSDRRLYTWRGTYSGATFPLTLTQVDDVSGTFFTAVDQGTGDPTILGLAAAATTTNVSDLIGWMMGKDTYDEDGDPTTTTRWAVADPLHSRPVAVTYGAHGGDYDQPVVKLVMAGNDGAIRMFNDYNGKEEWAFIPQEMLSYQADMADNAEGLHIYGVDNTVTMWIQDNDNDGIIEPADSDKVYLYVSLRRGTDSGGVSYLYALNITPASTITDKATTSGIVPKLLWVIEGDTGDFMQLGQTWSAPQVTTIRVKKTGSESEDKTALIFGGGFDSAVENTAVYPTVQDKVVTKNNPGSTGNAVFIVDADTGARIWWASSSSAVDGSGDNADLQLPDMTYPIPSNLSLLDSNGDGATDRLYVGDVGGQLWRIDLDPLIDPAGSNASARNGNTSGYVFADLVCDRASTMTSGSYTRNCPATDVPQDWRRIFYAPDVAGVTDSVYVSSGEAERVYDMVFVVTGDRPDPVDRLTNSALSPKQYPVQNAVYALKDTDYAYGTVASPPKPITPHSGEVHDATDNLIETGTSGEQTTAFNELRDGKGWMVYFKEADPGPSWTATDPVGVAAGGAVRPWVGEKSLAKPVIYGGVLYVTTYTPANESMSAATCDPNEGLGKVYGLNYLDAKIAIDLDGDGTQERSVALGGGIPSELVTVIREDGTTGLVGSSGGAAKVGVKDISQQERTYWYQE